MKISWVLKIFQSLLIILFLINHMGFNYLDSPKEPLKLDDVNTLNNLFYDFDKETSNSEYCRELTKSQPLISTKSSWVDFKFLYRKKIIISASKVKIDLSNFPILLDLYDPDLKNVKQDNGDDILFTDQFGKKLPHEIELFDQNYNKTHGHLVAWIQSNLFSSYDEEYDDDDDLSLTKDSVIFMYYGNTLISNQTNPDEVWTEGYTAVWHLSEITGPRYDSTNNSFDGSPQNFDNDEGITGQIAGADDFDGVDDYIETYRSTEDLGIIGKAAKTISVWVNTRVFNDGGVFEFGQEATRKYFSLKTLTKANMWRGDWWGDYDDFVYPSLDSWVYFVVTFEKDQIKIYADSKLIVDSNRNLVTANKVSFKIGSWHNNTFNGLIDELRVSSLARSPEWIQTEYLNQRDPSSFYTVGSQESDTNPPIVNSFGVEDNGDGNPIFYANVTDNFNSVKDVTININGTDYDMAENSSGIWIYQSIEVNFGDSLVYYISNASDSFDNFISPNKNDTKSVSLDIDKIVPNILQWYYDSELEIINLSISDSWGTIDTVLMNVTTFNTQLRLVQSKIISKNMYTYYNDTLNFPYGPIKFLLFVNDTAGNEYTSPILKTFVTFNNPPLIENTSLNPMKLFSNSSLVLTYDYYDEDNHPESGTEIRWYSNSGNGFILQKEYNDNRLIPSSALIRDEQWYATIQPKDGISFGTLVNTSEFYGYLTVLNTPPQINIIENEHPEFIIEDGDLILYDTYYNFNDNDNDSDQSFIWWYKNGVLQSEYNNKKVISSDVLHSGDSWCYIVRPNDDFDNGTDEQSPDIIIESRPQIIDYEIIAYDDHEGHYLLKIQATDSRNKIKYVQLKISVNETTQLASELLSSPALGTSDIWIFEFQLVDYSLLDEMLDINVEVASELLNYSTLYIITSTFSFSFILEDRAPPRVNNAYFVLNDEIDPENIIFYAEIEEYGSGINEIILFYYFEEENMTGVAGGGGSIFIQTNQPWKQMTMTLYKKAENSSVYSTTVTLPQDGTNLKVIYRISTNDNDGNINEEAFLVSSNQAERDRIVLVYPKTELDPSLTIIIVFLNIIILTVCTVIIAIIYGKFLRKTETVFVGLDKSLVMSKISQLSDSEIKQSLDEHTFGIVVSVFDEKSGPIPLFVIPNILKDDNGMLLSLCFRAFSNCEFTLNFDRMNQAFFNFSSTQNDLIKVLSYSFALDRPEARAGAENITLSILFSPIIFPIIERFADRLSNRVSVIHKLLDKHPEDIKSIKKEIIILRELVSRIILSYYAIYGENEYYL